MVETPEEFQALVETYGPLYKYSPVKRGETVRYRIPGYPHIYVGSVLWAQSPGEQGGVHLPMRYVVHCAERGFVDIVFNTDLLRDE